jgi:SAM-dependent methyltransferase
MLKNYFKNLYQRTMLKAYEHAQGVIFESMQHGEKCLDCGAGEGNKYEILRAESDISKEQYVGLEWSEEMVSKARGKNINVLHADLNQRLPFEDGEFDIVFGLSVLEHLISPCHYLKECKRVLKEGGKLVILTPNISTYFTAMLILLGRMPSSGPHPDSDLLLENQQLFKVSSESLQTDAEEVNPSHRHLVVFSYRVLKKYLQLIGFVDVEGAGYGLYPFPGFLQPILEKLDRYHCHQMVFIATKDTNSKGLS